MLTGASAVDECQTMSYPKVYSSAADSSSESLQHSTTSIRIIMLDVIRAKP